MNMKRCRFYAIKRGPISRAQLLWLALSALVLCITFARPHRTESLSTLRSTDSAEVSANERIYGSSRGWVNTTIFQPMITKPYVFPKLSSPALEDILRPRLKWTNEEWVAEAERVLANNRYSEEGRDDGSKKGVDSLGVVIATAANAGMTEMTMNWVASLKLHGYHKFVVFAYDLALYRTLCEYGHGYNVVMAPEAWIGNANLTQSLSDFNSDTYNALVNSKLLLMLELNRLRYSVLMTDVDLVFLSPYVLKHIRFEYFENSPREFVYMVDNNIGRHDVINGGFYYMRPTALMAQILSRTYNLTQSGIPKLGSDQLALNHVISEELKIKYGPAIASLEKTLYASGWVLRWKHKSEDWRIYPLVAHFNWIQMANKKKSMQKLNMWFIGDKAFSNKF